MNLYAANQALGNLCFTYICEIVFDIEIKLNEINRMKSSRTRTRHSKNNVFLIGSFVAIFLFFFTAVRTLSKVILQKYGCGMFIHQNKMFCDY